MSKRNTAASSRITRHLVIPGLVLALGSFLTPAASASPFDGRPVAVVSDSRQESQGTPASLTDIIARKNAIPNFPWNWKKRDQVLLEGAKRLTSTADIIALTKESGFKSVRDEIILLGINTPKNLSDVQALCASANKAGTKDKILLANLGKMSWTEILGAATMATPTTREQMIRSALSRACELNRQAGNKVSATFWLTDPARIRYLEKQSVSPRFGALTVDGPTITVNEAETFQAVDGFGFALTGGSAQLINSLPVKERAALLRSLFSTDFRGIGATMLRLSIGASDLSAKSFTFDDMPEGQTDPNLDRFDISAGDKDLIPVLKEILGINPSLRIIATPWSAPSWMKSKQSFTGGSLLAKWRANYANYFVKYIEAMRDNGIRIAAITPQNEPLNGTNEPSMLMEANDQAAFIKDHLGPALRNAGLNDVELFCWDHNCDKKEYPLSVLSDDDARQYISGVAWHLYAGDVSALSEVRQAFPDMKMYLTEQYTDRKGTFAGDFRWHLRTVLLGSLRNWSQAVLEWNLVSDPSCDPHTRGGCPDCRGAVTVSPESKAHQPFNVSYYIIGHASRFIRPGSVRVSTNQAGSLPNVAFLTPEGKIALIVLNDSETPQLFNIQWQGKTAMAYLNVGAAGTFVWSRDYSSSHK